jgi:hypothetical protein
MRSFAQAFQALLIAFLIIATASGAPDDDQKQARKDLKKNVKKLAQVDQALAETQQQLEQVLGAPKVNEQKQRETEDQMNQLRDMGGELVFQIARADDEDAAEFLVTIAVGTRSNDLHERIQSEVSRMTSDEAVGWMAETLGAGLGGEGGRGGGGRRRGGDDAWKAQVFIARVFESIDHEATIPPILAQLEKGTSPQVVNVCVKTAGRKQDKRVVGALIGFLGRVEQQGGWEYHQVRQALVDLTGQDFFTQERWQAWWTAEEAAWDWNKRGETREAATRERAAEEKVPTFFGSEIASNRVCFIIDTSGSMQMTDRPAEHALSEEDFIKADPDTPELRALKRIERAKRALTECVSSLQPTQRFNIIAFSSGNRLWKPAVVEATPQNKSEALRFVEGLRDDGGTNTHDALEAAFADPAIDTIYLLSDGAPMVKVGNPGEQMRAFARDEVRRVLDLVRRENRFRGVKIYTFGMDGPGVWHRKWEQPRPVSLPTEPEWLSILQGFMRELATITGGEYKSI